MENTGNVIDTFQRYLAMLRIIPRHPRVIDGAEIEKKLVAQGICVTRRTIQRDLEKLSAIVPIVSRDGKPRGWSWSRVAQLQELPGMDAATALTFRLVELFLGNRLPAMVMDAIDPHLKRAREVLAGMGSTGMARWPGKIAVVPRGMEFVPPTIAPDVLELVYEALLLEKRLQLQYRGRDSEMREYSGLSPLGLVFVDGLIYLVGALAGEDFPRQFLLHRMADVRILTDQAVTPEGFSLKGYIASREFSYPLTERKMRLRALFDREATTYLRETPLTVDQMLTERRDGRILLEAEVPDTVQLRYWLRGFGAQVEVIGPKNLRDEFTETAKLLAKRYKSSGE